MDQNVLMLKMLCAWQRVTVRQIIRPQMPLWISRFYLSREEIDYLLVEVYIILVSSSSGKKLSLLLTLCFLQVRSINLFIFSDKDSIFCQSVVVMPITYH